MVGRPRVTPMVYARRAMRRAGLVAIGVLPAGCLLFNPAYDPGGEGSSGAASGTGGTGAPTSGATSGGATTSGATSGGATTGGGTAGGSTTGDVSTGAVASTGGTTAAPDLGGPQYPYYPVTSCVELQEYIEDDLGETPVSGLYSLDVVGKVGATVDVYCDMEIAGGGWTLVGRSAGVVQRAAFGWTSARGDVADDGQPYSLDLAAHPIAFAEILLGDYSAGKQWGGYAYLFNVGQDYVSTYAQSLKKLGQPQPILGGCMPWDTWMFQHGGFTSVDQAFFFRDLGEMDNAYFGLLANGFYLHTYMGCERTGELNHKQGMLMVR